MDENEAVRAPRHLTASEVATLPVAALTAWHSLYAVGTVRPGDTVVVQGGGGVSLAAVQFARAGGARVISVVRKDTHRKALLDAGAEHVVISGGNGEWAEEVFRLTSRRGADTVIDVAGGSSIKSSIKSTRVGGRVHLVGYAARTSTDIDIFEAIRHAVTINVGMAGHRASFEAMIMAIEVNKICPIRGLTYKASEFRLALAQGGHLGKIVLELGDGL